MKEHPILFSAPMVRALLAGTKTQTRRAVKKMPWHDTPSNRWIVPLGLRHQKCDTEREAWALMPLCCPYGTPGDRLWVREAWRVGRHMDGKPPRELEPRTMTVLYEAGGSMANDEGGAWCRAPWPEPRDRPDWAGKLRPAMFMPRWASRITLDVTRIRAQRLQDISEADAEAEGCTAKPAEDAPAINTARQDYRDLWERINGAGSWAANPLVWVVKFRAVDR